MLPLIHGALAVQHQNAAEQERLRRLEEEELMTGYTPEEASGPWQFKIVRGTFKTARQVEAVQHEQAEYGWILVEIFDQHRIRFKRLASEAAKDSYREGNPYATVSKASGPGCGAAVVLLAVLVSAAFLAPVFARGTAEPQAQISGDAVIRARAGKSEIVLTTTTRVAGAIHSLTWNGKEFLDSFDHGRQLQSAANFDCGHNFISETFNPTEAGSRADGVGPRSSSKLQRLHARGAELQTTTQMAFWLAPGEKSAGHPARNDRMLSHHLVSKRVRIGYKGLEHAISYDVTFTVPKGERHTYAQFEAVTGYMPAEFSRFWKFDPTSGKLQPLSDGPGEQEFPVVLATPDGAYAMGVYSPDQPSRGYEKAGYGRFRFKAEKVVKWNCVFRIREARGIAAGRYRFHTFVAVGSLEDVRRTLSGLVKEFRQP